MRLIQLVTNGVETCGYFGDNVVKKLCVTG